MNALDEEFPDELKLHVVMDNYGTRKHARVQRWLGELTGKRLRRGVFVSVEDLQKAIEECLAQWNSAPKPLVWTATVESIVQKLNRCKQTLEQIKPGCTQPRRRKNKGK